jgi:hypothetical protein
MTRRVFLTAEIVVWESEMYCKRSRWNKEKREAALTIVSARSAVLILAWYLRDLSQRDSFGAGMYFLTVTRFLALIVLLPPSHFSPLTSHKRIINAQTCRSIDH